MVFRLCIKTSIRAVVGPIGRLLAVLGVVTASSVVCAGQETDESQVYEKLHYALQRASADYTNLEFLSAKRELDEALVFISDKRSMKNAVLENRLQRLRGDVARALKGEAEEYYRKALEALNRSEGVWIEHRAKTQAALSMLLVEKGRTSEAVGVAAKTIEDVKEVLGDDANKTYFCQVIARWR